ncbi:hypothetical protein ESB13_17210 [Filimonas effusa]|uniref:Uncharacterized protein n=2 Tax=Filimonas effusa TaxID=2508721 RepID=A0A4Q1D5M0_9BACT|nr:hypothetical protein ESB13_17210 [Filimonas effusa]
MSEHHLPFYETGNDTSVFYSRPYDYSIYEVSKLGLKKKYTFIFPMENSIPDSFWVKKVPPKD